MVANSWKTARREVPLRSRLWVPSAGCWLVTTSSVARGDRPAGQLVALGFERPEVGPGGDPRLLEPAVDQQVCQEHATLQRLDAGRPGRAGGPLVRTSGEPGESEDSRHGIGLSVGVEPVGPSTAGAGRARRKERIAD